MSTEVRHRRGTASEHSTFIGAVSEFTHDTTANTIRVHDGETPGGNPLATMDDVGRFEYAHLLNPGGSSQNLLIRNPLPGATRIHQEPNGYVDSGTVTKYDWMLDPFDDDPLNYRILNIYTKTGDAAGTGEPGIAVINAKNVGHHWGNWVSMHFGFQDDGVNSVPLKLHLLDHSAPQHYTPHKGGWRAGYAVTTGDYITTLVGGTGRLYIAASTGTTGATVPSHETGTFSDGGVNWTFVRSVASGSVRPVTVIGDRDDMPLLGWMGTRLQLLRDFLVGWGAKQRFINAAGQMVAELKATQTGGVNDWFEIATGGGGYLRFSRDQNYMQFVGMAVCSGDITAPVNATTVDVTGVETLEFRNTSPTLVAYLTGGKPGQRLRCVANNSNTSLKYTGITSGGAIRNNTLADIPLTIEGAVDLQMDKTGGFWRVVGVGY